jgi:drug/metabolite transporter (DMT)-like permease
VQPEGKILAALAVVAMAVCYAAGGLLIRAHLSAVRPASVALWTSVVATVAVLPAGIARAPSQVPGFGAIASVVVLGILGTAFAYLLFFTIVAGAGASYASFVTYLVPPFALAYGALFLDESVGGAAVAGLALILGGVALGTGLSRRRRASAPVVGGASFARTPSEPS